MAKKQPEASQTFAIGMQSGFKPSAELQARLNRLSPQQASGVIHIAEEELMGRSLTAILLADDRPCSYSTFWHKKRNGWMHKPVFVEALNMARQEVRGHRLATSVDEAVERLKVATVDAARDLHRQITGDVGAIEALSKIALDKGRDGPERTAAVRALGDIGSQSAVDELLKVLETTQAKAYVAVRQAIIEELGRAGAATDTRRRLADMTTLDRADKMTASKSSGDRTADEMSDDELEAIARGSGNSGTGVAAPAVGPPKPN
ncbi:hypothetical protein TFLX_03134 [Thermoflexales bacterium]|nr:hypothetical protein TFLX_03134 [Thermoflexales bacterium]